MFIRACILVTFVLYDGMVIVCFFCFQLEHLPLCIAWWNLGRKTLIFFQKTFFSFLLMKGKLVLIILSSCRSNIFYHFWRKDPCNLPLNVPIISSSHWFLVIICYPQMVAENAGKNCGIDEHTSLEISEVCLYDTLLSFLGIQTQSTRDRLV